MTSPHMDAAASHLRKADELGEAVAQSRLAGHHERAGRILGHQRSEVKRAEVAALLAIADELSRLGLAR